MTLRYEHHRDPQEALRVRLRELAGSRVRYGYRRLTVLLEARRLEGKREAHLPDLHRGGADRAHEKRENGRSDSVCRGDRQRVPTRSGAWISSRSDWPIGRWIRVLTVVDQFTRECLTLFADNSTERRKGGRRVGQGCRSRGGSGIDHRRQRTEFASKAMDLWAYKNGVHLDFIRPGRPVENGYIESFNGKLRDECLNVEVFFNLADARRKL